MERSLGLTTRFLSRENNACFRSFQGSLERKSKNSSFSSKHRYSDHTRNLQGLDEVVNKPFKDRVCAMHRGWIVSGNCSLLTPARYTRWPSEALLGQWIKTSWNNICPRSHCRMVEKVLCAKMNGTDDEDYLWEENRG